jgi:dihydroorotase
VDLLLRGGRVLDPAGGVDRAADLLVADGVIARIGAGLAAPSRARVLELGGRLVVPGLIDLHVHLREPGQEHKEDIASGTAAAAAGGFTTVCCMPNTVPPNDSPEVTARIVRRAAEVGRCRVRPIAAVSVGQKGEALTDLRGLRAAGAVAFSDDGRPVMDAEILRQALAGARELGATVSQHAEDLALAAGGALNAGPIAERLGLRGQPGVAESALVARDLEICAATGGRYHVAHASTARTVDLIRAARRRGLPVSCEVTPHHLVLTEDACAGGDPVFKVAPPLRAADDVAALRAALADGTVDAIATDHAPHAAADKDRPFAQAAFGMLGLETALALVLGLVAEGVIGLARAVALLTSGPARCFGLAAGVLAEGAPADVTVIDLDRAWTIDRDRLASRSRNTPYHGRAVRGRALLTLVGGTVAHDLDRALKS